MPYAPRTVSFLGHDPERRLKHYSIGTDHPQASPGLIAVTRRLALEVLEPEDIGFTIAHDGVSSAMALIYCWRAENELYSWLHAGPLDDPQAVVPIEGHEMTCVFELEVIDFERRAWIEHVLKDDDLDAYLAAALAEVAV